MQFRHVLFCFSIFSKLSGIWRGTNALRPRRTYLRISLQHEAECVKMGTNAPKEVKMASQWIKKGVKRGRNAQNRSTLVKMRPKRRSPSLHHFWGRAKKGTPPVHVHPMLAFLFCALVTKIFTPSEDLLIPIVEGHVSNYLSTNRN